MKYQNSAFFIVTLMLFALTLTAQQPTPKPVAPAPTVAKLTTSTDTIQYTLGAFMGRWLVDNGFTITNQVLFKRGMDDVLQKKPLSVNDTTIVPRIAAYQLSIQNERSKQLEEQLFSALKGKAGVGVLPNGVHYLVVKTGTGIRPLAADSIEINAIGIFPDGTVFEDTFQKKKTIKTVTGSMIPGLNETVQLMQEGSVWRIFVPSALAYGPAGLANLIPANTALIYDITLIKVKAKK